MDLNKLITIISISCYTPGTISGLFSIISTPAAGIKQLLVSRSTIQNSSSNISTNDLMGRTQLMDQLTSNGASCKAPDLTADTAPFGMMHFKDSTFDIVHWHRLLNTKHTTD